VAFRKSAKIELLRRTPLFSECTKGELAAIAAIADEVEIPVGEALMKEGERGREFFALIEGTVDVRRGGRKVAIKGGSEFFGEIALISSAPRNATVTATSPVRALVVTERAFARLLRESPQLQLKVLRSLAERVAPDEPV
jgi:CRP/FNR family transcriptional regulator, cyclic AMP receptor protein